MRYIHLNNDSYIIYLSTGIRTVTRTSFNFNKIKRLINNGANEAQILPLLKIPSLPNGIYEAYTEINKKTNRLVYLHTAPDGVQKLQDFTTGYELTLSPSELILSDDMNFVGVYASFEALTEDWPEYLL